ncbi:riboflavin biosynthesis protein PYRD, chloroplastic [Dorcoceras hygrometricum]|uniref:Riboflavin biosynthesis protein PYRD, chloroplastic n=1 Tax=Dorcoceras hygrometricum TaxID=472368 RepID=A0A2Z6ZSH4_9LAMI|nr:riboflavin biosynthesis protein PYRD, chloroplastic [Dorcoceras hygrometricum]
MRAGRAWWPRRARCFAQGCTVDGRWSRAPGCAEITHGGRCVAPIAGRRDAHWLRNIMAARRAVAGHWTRDFARGRASRLARRCAAAAARYVAAAVRHVSRQRATADFFF